MGARAVHQAAPGGASLPGPGDGHGAEGQGSVSCPRYLTSCGSPLLVFCRRSLKRLLRSWCPRMQSLSRRWTRRLGPTDCSGGCWGAGSESCRDAGHRKLGQGLECEAARSLCNLIAASDKKWHQWHISAAFCFQAGRTNEAGGCRARFGYFKVVRVFLLESGSRSQAWVPLNPTKAWRQTGLPAVPEKPLRRSLPPNPTELRRVLRRWRSAAPHLQRS